MASVLCVRAWNADKLYIWFYVIYEYRNNENCIPFVYRLRSLTMSWEPFRVPITKFNNFFSASHCWLLAFTFNNVPKSQLGSVSNSDLRDFYLQSLRHFLLNHWNETNEMWHFSMLTQILDSTFKDCRFYAITNTRFAIRFIKSIKIGSYLSNGRECITRWLMVICEDNRININILIKIPSINKSANLYPK